MDQVVFKEKGAFKHKPADQLLISDKVTIGHLIEAQAEMMSEYRKLQLEMSTLKKIYQDFMSLLEDKLILTKGDTVIAQVDGQLQRMQVDNMFANADINLKFYKVEDGKLVEDKSKILEMI